MKYITTVGGQTFEIEIKSDTEVLLNGEPVLFDFQAVAEESGYSLLLNGESFEGYLYPSDQGIQVFIRGRQFQVTVEDERERRLRESASVGQVASGEIHLKSPMPGLIVGVPVEEGQAVAAGETLVILESMKMQNELKAPRGGTVSRVRVKAGERVEQNQPLLSLA
jgi:biotin carboxyl carrier protein